MATILSINVNNNRPGGLGIAVCNNQSPKIGSGGIIYQYFSIGQSWANRVVTNGGNYPSASIPIVDTFWGRIQSASLDSKMKVVNVMAPDNLIACFTPIYISGSNCSFDPWNDADISPYSTTSLTVNGLQSAGSPQHLNIGFSAFHAWNDDTQGGMTTYFPSGTTMIGSAVNTRPNTIRGFTMVSTSTGSFQCWSTGSGEITNITPILGFRSMNRTSPTSLVVYSNNQSVNNFTSSIKTTTGGTRPSASLLLFAVNEVSSPQEYAAGLCSFAAVHDGLTATQAENFYNIVNQLRVDFGGGYI